MRGPRPGVTRRCRALYTEPESPRENGYVESFNGSLRGELLRREVFDTLLEAKILVERRRRDRSEVRPHSSLGYRPPARRAGRTLKPPKLGRPNEERLPQVSEGDALRIGIQTWGSEGDVVPLAALAGGLRSAGHDVTLAVTSTEARDFAGLCRSLDVRYVQVGGTTCDWQARTRRLSDAPNRLAALKTLVADIYLRYLDEMYEASEALCARSDFVIGHVAACPLKPVARKVGKPYASVMLWPGLLPHRYPRPGALPILSAVRGYAAFAVLRAFGDLLLRTPVRRLWSRAGLRPLRHVVPDAWQSDLLNLVAASSIFCATPRHRPMQPLVCGYFHLPEQADSGQCPAGLDEFLSEGEPPVYMTFGLMEPYRPDTYAELFASAARLAGCRAIIQTTSARHPPNTRSRDLYFVARSPHRLVFPRCAAVVHHGGGGTVHTVTRCGRPSVVVAFSREHLWYGQYLFRLGAASDPLHHRTVTAARLGRRIRAVLDRTQIARRAEALGELMRQEHGVARAVEAIHALEP